MISNNSKNICQTILLTGATGFLGSHLSAQLIEKGHKVVIIKRSFSRIDRIKPLMGNLISYDIDLTGLGSVFKENSIDVVVHTATRYGRNGEKLSEIASSNLTFPLELLDYCREYGVGTFINTDTFSNLENDSSDHLYAYVLSKKQLLKWFRPFQSCMKIFNLKLEHPYGENDDFTKFIPFVIRELMNGVEALKLTPGDQKRDFVYVGDVVEAYCEVISKSSFFSNGFYEYDIGSGASRSIKEAVGLVKKILNNKATVLNFGALPYRKGEMMDSVAELSKIRNDIGWKPVTGLEEGLKKTINWYKDNLSI